MRELFVTVFVAVVLAVGAAVPAATAQAAEGLKVSFLAFAQGDATLYEAGCGEQGLIDAGRGSADEILAALDASGSRSLEWVNVSHYDADHLGDVAAAATTPGVSVGAFIDGGGGRDEHDSQTYRAYYDLVTGRDARTVVDVGDEFYLCQGTASETAFEVVSAGYDGTAAQDVTVTSANDKGICVKVRRGAFDLASCGDVNGTDEGSRSDVETAVASAYGDVDMVKVNHHCSASSSNATYVATLKAEAAVCLVGSNGFGHPSQPVIDRWTASGAEMFQTLHGDGHPQEGQDKDGEVTVTVTDDSWTIAGATSGRTHTFSLTSEGGATGPGTAAGFDGDPGTVDAQQLDDSASYSIAVSKLRFPDTHVPLEPVGDVEAHVVLASATTFADALAGSALAADGPMLLTDAARRDAVNAEINRVLPPGGRIYVLGGVNAVADELLPAGYDVVRLAGPSRVETAIEVAKQVRALYGAGDGTVLLARAYGEGSAAFADSLTVGGYAAARRAPLLLTSTDTLHHELPAVLAELVPSRTVLLGGTAALSSTVEHSVPRPTRVAGSARDVTATAIATTLWGSAASQHRIVIDGYDADAFRWGLPLAGFAADTATPLLITADGVLPSSTSEAIGTTTGDTLLVGAFPAGGFATVADQLQTAVARRGDIAEPPDSPAAPLQITGVVADPDGDDVQPETGEHLTIHNPTSGAVAVDGWYILDAADNRLDVGPGYTIPAGATLRVYTGPGTNTPDRYYNGKGSAVLNNTGDTLRLYAPDGTLIDTFAY